MKPRPQPARRRLRSAVRAAAILALLAHSVAVLWIWRDWESGLRGGWLVWMDFPVSLAYLEARGRMLLALSLVLGGAWWAVIGGGLSWLVGRITRDS